MFFFHGRTQWFSFFHKIPDFSCSCYVKRVFSSPFVWKCTDMCTHRFGVQLLQNPPLFSSTLTTATPRVSQFALPSPYPTTYTNIMHRSQANFSNSIINSTSQTAKCTHLHRSNYLYRGPTELAQHSAYRGSSHQRKGAASHKIDMIWLYHSPILVGRRRLYYFFIVRLPVFAAHWGRGRGSQHPVLWPQQAHPL